MNLTLSDLLIPKSLIGWVTFFILSFFSYILLEEGIFYLKKYLHTSEWKNTTTTSYKIITKEQSLSFEIDYSFSAGSYIYYGKAIGVERKATKEATKKEIKELSRKQATAQPIEIKYNPEDPNQSFFFFDKNSIYFAVFLMLFPISLGLIIVFIIFSKIKIRSS